MYARSSDYVTERCSAFSSDDVRARAMTLHGRTYIIIITIQARNVIKYRILVLRWQTEITAPSVRPDQIKDLPRLEPP